MSSGQLPDVEAGTEKTWEEQLLPGRTGGVDLLLGRHAEGSPIPFGFKNYLFLMEQYAENTSPCLDSDLNQPNHKDFFLDNWRNLTWTGCQIIFWDVIMAL